MRTAIRSLNVSLIDPPLIAMREKEIDVTDIIQSVKAFGSVLQPICVRPVGKRLQLVYGSRRLQAYLKLGWEKIPALIVDVSDEAAIMMSMTENADRTEANPLFEARALKELLTRGLSIKQIAGQMGKSSSWVRQRLELLQTSRVVQEAVERGEMEPSKAIILGKAPETKQPELLKEAQEQRLTREQIESRVRLVTPKTEVEEEAELRRRHEAIKKLLPYSEPLTLEWKRGKQERDEEGELLRGKVVDTTIEIYDSSLEKAEETLRHEHLECNLRVPAKYVVDTYNEAFERLLGVTEKYLDLHFRKEYPELHDEERPLRVEQVINEEKERIDKQTLRIRKWCYEEADRLASWLAERITALKLV